MSATHRNQERREFTDPNSQLKCQQCGAWTTHRVQIGTRVAARCHEHSQQPLVKGQG